DFTLDGGARFQWANKDIDYLLFSGIDAARIPTPLSQSDTWKAVTGEIRLTYRFREDTHAYWKYNRGWKPGHYNATGSPTSGITTAKPEKIDSFETGLRADWFGGLVSGDASLFYYNYKDYQIFTAKQFAGGPPEFVAVNANNAEGYGAEIDGGLKAPRGGGYLDGRFRWLRAHVLDYAAPP